MAVRARTDNGAGSALAQLGLTADDVALLGRLPLFGGVAPPRLARLLAGASVRFYERNARLFAQGEAADRFFVVLDGWVRLFREAPNGQESTIARLRARREPRRGGDAGFRPATR